MYQNFGLLYGIAHPNMTSPNLYDLHISSEHKKIHIYMCVCVYIIYKISFSYLVLSSVFECMVLLYLSKAAPLCLLIC